MSDDIDAMTDEQLRFAVAIEVMGWKHTNNPDSLSDKEETWVWVHPNDGLLVGTPYMGKYLFDHSWKRWRPDSDIAAAWSVFVACLLKFGGVCIEGDMENYGRGAFTRGEADGVMTVHIDGWSVTDKPERAICRAALHAVRNVR